MKLRTALLSALFVSAALSPANAASDVVVKVDDAKMLAVTGDPATVVVGNPNIADVTVKSKAIFIHGRNFGSTNVIVLDTDGNELAAIDVTVMVNGNHNINVFRAGAKFSYSCVETCESDVRVGDNKDYFDTLQDQQKKKNTLANSFAQ